MGHDTVEERQTALKELFKDKGNIVHFQFMYFANTDGLMGCMEFILDIPLSSPRDLMLPRVKYLDTECGYNVMFSWAGNPFCFRCGHSDHIKMECPLPHSYSVANDSAFHEPIMGRAFPDLKATPRQVMTRAVAKPAPASSTPVNMTKDEWNVVGSKRNRSTRNMSNGSGSENESSGSPQNHIPKKSKPMTKTAQPAA
ncbi:hypothetical protein EC957_001964, partial [Mortierella hygrophila]